MPNCIIPTFIPKGNRQLAGAASAIPANSCGCVQPYNSIIRRFEPRVLSPNQPMRLGFGARQPLPQGTFRPSRYAPSCEYPTPDSGPSAQRVAPRLAVNAAPLPTILRTSSSRTGRRCDCRGAERSAVRPTVNARCRAVPRLRAVAAIFSPVAWMISRARMMRLVFCGPTDSARFGIERVEVMPKRCWCLRPRRAAPVPRGRPDREEPREPASPQAAPIRTARFLRTGWAAWPDPLCR